jgi:hypothetical protein
MDAVLIFLILLVALYWLLTIILLIIGLWRIRSRPENAKKLLIGSGIMILVGAGICGALIN